MKKKIVKSILGIAFIALVAVSFFKIGKFTEERKQNKNNIENACVFMGNVVDWNQKGNELAVTTKDGYEFYVYKTENVYE